MPEKKPVRAELSVNGETVMVKFDYHPLRVKKVKRVPSYRFVAADKKEGPGWRLNLDMPTMRKLRSVFGDELALGPELKRWGHRQVEKERNLSDLSDANDAELENISSQFQKWLRPYQRADIRFMAETNVINANQPRTGKTPTTIAATIEAQMEWGRHLVFAPVQALREVWENGIYDAYLRQGSKIKPNPKGDWDFGDYEAAFKKAKLDMPVVLTGDTPAERRQAVEEAKELADQNYAYWLILNWYMGRVKTIMTLRGKEVTKERIKKLKAKDVEALEREEVLRNPELSEIKWDSITVDEFHLCGLSNPATDTARGLNKIAEESEPERKYALSGTPMGGKPIKLWGALKFLNPEEFTSRWHWARHWLVIQVKSTERGDHSNIEGIMPGREVDFYEHLKPYLVRRTQAEALPGLPPVNRINVWCGMTKRQQEQYIVFATEAEWRIEDAEEEGRLTATNLLAEWTRLKQFADGYCSVKKTGRETAEGLPILEVRQTDDSGKLEKLLEILEEVNVIGQGQDDEDLKCALISSQFNPMADMVAEALKKKKVPTERLIAGKKKLNDAIVKAFQTQKAVEYRGAWIEPPRVLVMNTAMGTALTLDRAETVHILDETWVPDNQEQMEQRVTPTTDEKMKARADTGVYYYRTRMSIEEYVQKVVADKDLNNKTILDLRRRIQQALKQGATELNRGAELIEHYGSVNDALHATHPDHGGNAEDFRAVMAARIEGDFPKRSGKRGGRKSLETA